MRNITGAPTRATDFFDRQFEIGQFWLDLETDNLLLLAPRRIGKTSILLRMQEQVHGYGFEHGIFQDVSDCQSELSFVKKLAAAILETEQSTALWHRLEKSPVGQLISRVQKAGAATFSVEFRTTDEDWESIGEQIFGTLNQIDGRWLIMIDELPVFVSHLMHATTEAEQPARIRKFLYWLRRLRMSFANIRWAFAGSIGLDTITSRLKISDSINDLRIVAVGPFSRQIAEEFLGALAGSYHVNLGKDVVNAILDRLGWLAPFYVQLAFKQLRSLPQPWSVDSVQTAIDSLLEPQYRTHFDYWRQRLDVELDPLDAAHAKLLLLAAARDPHGVTAATLSQAYSKIVPDTNVRSERLRFLLDVLLNDGYLVKHESRYRFLFPLLREYWLRHVAPYEEG